MTLEEKLDVDCIYAAKLIAPHLELSFPKISEPSRVDKAQWMAWGLLYKGIYGVAIGAAWVQDSLYLLTHPKYWKQEREERKRLGKSESDDDILQSMLDAHDKDEKQLEQKLIAADVLMPQGRQAWNIAHYAGLCIKRNSFRENYVYGDVTLRAAWTRCENDGYYYPKILDEKGVDSSADISVVRPIEVCYNEEEFKSVLNIAIRDGVRCLTKSCIFNQEKTKDSLLQELYFRLDKEKEFRFLDVVDIRREQDKIYLKDCMAWDNILHSAG